MRPVGPEMRLLDHVSITVRYLADVTPFYEAILGVLGAERVYQRSDAIGFGRRNDADDATHSYLSLLESEHSVADPKRHYCFRAASVAEVKAFHRAGLAAGGTDAGEPGLRNHYHPGYFAAFLLDPEGNKVEAVCHHGDRLEAAI